MGYTPAHGERSDERNELNCSWLLRPCLRQELPTVRPPLAVHPPSFTPPTPTPAS